MSPDELMETTALSSKEVAAEQFLAVDQLRKCVEHLSDEIKAMVFYHALICEYMETNMDRAKAAYPLLVQEREKMVHTLGECRLPLLELEEEEKAAYAGVLKDNAAAFNLATPDYSTLERVLIEFISGLPASRQTVNAAVIGRLMNNVRMGYYPTDLKNVNHILHGIQFPEGIAVNLLDPCCGEGKAVQHLATGGVAHTYGVELDKERSACAQEVLDRVGFGSFFGSQISHNAFHALFLNPPYLSVLNADGRRSRDEKKFLLEAIPHLMPEGLLIYIVPFYRMTPDICTILADNFCNLSAWRFTDSEFKNFKQLAVFGIKKPLRIRDMPAAKQMELMSYNVAELPCISEIPTGSYALPTIEKSVDLFKGAQFNRLELARQLRQSDSFNRLFSKSGLDKAGRRPPLPLSIGQVGLVGGSGMVNGLIECEYPHAIKGRIVKVKTVQEEPIYGNGGRLISTESRETTSNKMVFGVLTPDGYTSLV